MTELITHNNKFYDMKIYSDGKIRIFENKSLLWEGTLVNLIFELGVSKRAKKKGIHLSSLMKKAKDISMQQFDRERMKDKGWY